MTDGQYLLSMEQWAAVKKLSVSVAMPTAPVLVPSQRPLAPSAASVRSVTNDKGDDEMILCTDLLAFAKQQRKTPEISARRPSDEGAVRPVIASNGVPFLQMRLVGPHSTSGKEKEGNKEGYGWTVHT